MNYSFFLKKKRFTYFYIHWYSASIYVCAKVSGPLDLEL